MELRVIFEAGDPPCGHVEIMNPRHPTGRPPTGEIRLSIAFTGWLGLLRVLSDLLARPDDR
ncbi:MAG: hypothetical protein ACRD2W_20070 [Acidimicrobiales bacterium]